MSAQAEQTVYLRQEGAIGYLILNNPKKRNAISFSMWKAIPDLVRQAVAEPSIKVLVVQGVDASAFAAGADISEFEQMFSTVQGCRSYHEAIRDAEQTLGACPKPTIAMIHGPCVGGGVELALACDMRFASADSRLGVTASKLGIVYSLTSTRRLVQLMGPSTTKDVLFSGRLFDAQEAAAMGLVDRVFAAPDLERETLAYADVLCQRAPQSIAAAKQIVEIILGGAHDETSISERLRLDSFSGAELAEGIKAYKEQRPPVFTTLTKDS
jgi:enoyl-CoA hydratase